MTQLGLINYSLPLTPDASSVQNIKVHPFGPFDAGGGNWQLRKGLSVEVNAGTCDLYAITTGSMVFTPDPSGGPGQVTLTRGDVMGSALARAISALPDWYPQPTLIIYKNVDPLDARRAAQAALSRVTPVTAMELTLKLLRKTRNDPSFTATRDQLVDMWLQGQIPMGIPVSGGDFVGGCGAAPGGGRFAEIQMVDGTPAQRYFNPSYYLASWNAMTWIGDGDPLRAEQTDTGGPAAVTATGRLVFVSKASPSSVAPFTSPATASQTINAALNAASPGDTIVILDQSTYAEQIVINKAVSITSAGTRAATDPSPDYPIIDGQNSLRPVVVRAVEGLVQIGKVTITNGLAAKSVDRGSGGGILVDSVGMAVISNCAISNCKAQGTGFFSEGYGGGIASYHSSPAIVRCLVSDNQAASRGSGVGIWGYGWPAIFDSKISGNSSINTIRGDGGGIAIATSVTKSETAQSYMGTTVANLSTRWDSTKLASAANNRIRITRCTIENNRSGDDGAGLYISVQADVLMSRTNVLSNKAGGDGGGVRVSMDSKLHMTDCRVSNNEANTKNQKAGGGGISCRNPRRLKLERTIVSGNICREGAGGGLYFISSDEGELYTKDPLLGSFDQCHDPNPQKPKFDWNDVLLSIFLHRDATLDVAGDCAFYDNQATPGDHGKGGAVYVLRWKGKRSSCLGPLQGPWGPAGSMIDGAAPVHITITSTDVLQSSNVGSFVNRDPASPHSSHTTNLLYLEDEVVEQFRLQELSTTSSFQLQGNSRTKFVVVKKSFTGRSLLMDGFVPLRYVVPWPEDVLRFSASEDDLPMPDRIGLTKFEFDDSAPDETVLKAGIALLDEVSLEFPGLQGVAVVFGAPPPGSVAVGAEFTVNVVLADPVSIGLTQVDVALRFRQELLRPVVKDAAGKWVPNVAPDGVPRPFEIRLVGSNVSLDTDGDTQFGFASGAAGVAIDAFTIGDSGVVVEANQPVLLHFSRKTPPPPGEPQGWRGVYIEQATVYLPEGVRAAIPSDLTLQHCLIGSGGFSGLAAADWSPPFAGQLFGLSFALRSFSLEFVQNTIVGSNIRGTLTLPFFDEPLNVGVGIEEGGNFTATIDNPDGLYTLTKPGILTLKVASLAFEKLGDNFLVKLSGTIKLLYGGFDWPEVDVQELSIDKDGHIHIQGGWLELPKKASFDFDGFAMELTKIGFGNTDDGRRWVGFSGSIKLVEELSFGASVDGLKILWDAAGHIDVQLSDVKVDLTIPDAFQVSGFVQYFHDASSKGFKGDVKLALATPQIAFDAQMMVGRNTQTPPYNFFQVVVEVELPAGIPLGQTNAAIYGFTGMLGENVAPNKNAATEWYQWYSAAPAGATPVQKWTDSRGTLALGAGVTLGTASDNGFAFAAKTVLIVLLPGPLLLLDGKANMLRDRSALTTGEGQYKALAVIDGRAGTLLVDIQPQFKYDPITGAMAQITGLAEVFFDFHHHDAWHLYLGQDPPPKRIRGLIYQLIKADAYLMLDRQGMRLGASAGVDKHYDFGALKVALKAVMAGDAAVSWRPTQLDGQLSIEGVAELRAFGCAASATIDAALAVQTPHPLKVDGDVKVKLKTPWPLPDPSAHIHFEWAGADQTPEPPPSTVAAISAEHLKVTKSWHLSGGTAALQPTLGAPLPAHSARPGEVPAGAPVLPLDAKLLVAFSRPVVDRALIGSNGSPAPRPERVGVFDIAHELLGIELAVGSADGLTWNPVSSREGGTGDLFGMWLPLPEGDRAAGKLQLWGRSPFTYARNSGRAYVDWFTDQHPTYPCIPDEPPESVCSDFDALRLPVVPPLFVAGDAVFEVAFSNPSMRPALVVHTSPLTGTKRALQVSYLNSIPLRITPIEPSASVTVFVSHASDQVILTLRAIQDEQTVATATSAVTGDVALTVSAKEIEYVELAAAGLPDPQAGARLARVLHTASSAGSDR